ncbi:hypothetical protein CKO28_03080 [Rhodovibrio sodomensis]|uniref:Uncharacterized protein n=1 Tax=Rhodovibrio sodomensis TaxID=1088 RepID=A0ABS1DAT0_9PROT|nr:hypothetical protein [Rhodovibrio sodomensis]MBK1667027.1 hypothetical protein [Rhodovibrio sodomensis]
MSVTVLPCRVELQTVGVSLNRRPEFERTHKPRLWQRNNADQLKLIDWLTGHAPDWQDTARITGYGAEDVRLPGQAPIRRTVFYVTHWLIFQAAQHAREFREWQRNQEIRVAQRSHLLASAETYCEDCGGTITRQHRTEASRVGPVEIAYTAAFPRCAACDGDAGVLISADDQDVWREVAIKRLVRAALDLPGGLSDMSAAADRPALIHIACTPRTSDAEILGQLDTLRLPFLGPR